MEIARITRDWPGKGADANGIEHSAVLHMLDVAAVAERITPKMPENERRAFLLMAALHDLGKIGLAFRNMLRHRQPQTAGRHWEVTEALLRHHDETLLAPLLGGRWQSRYELYAASAGHHGRPPVNAEGHRKMIAAAGPQAVEDAATVISAFAGLWPGEPLQEFRSADAKEVSWRLAGLVTAADWIGSNPVWFPPVSEVADLRSYLDASRLRAEAAVAEAGLAFCLPSTGPLFDLDLRPMQAACATIDVPAGPMLALIEDETGSGKTEAALILAHRMLQSGKGQGMFLALPTMATADAMYARVAPVLARVFADPPSLVLSHGRARLHWSYRDRNPDDPGPTDWLADSRRRALLATVGIGTIDQALLAVVRARHSALRQFGLSRKILIVDEVHEMGDPYMGELLQELLRLHAAQDGSAVLMSATLDLRLRDRLIAAFREGAGQGASDLPGSAYPALTVPGVMSPAVQSRPPERGPVAVQRLPDPGEAVARLAAAARAGAVCVWVRNAVDEAMAAQETLRRHEIEADLLHARFALCDRKVHEARVLAAYGKARDPRPGRVLVATQVVESSLDLDFDLMVTDLAPMAALIQRAGRLWRHMGIRPEGGRPVPGPHLLVVSPDPEKVEGEGWAREVLGQGASVYPQALLWRTARALFRAGEIRAPDGLRELVEASLSGESVPEVLERAELKAKGEALAQKSHAVQNRIDRLAGYRLGASGAGDGDFPTRLGVPQTALVLMRGGQPWCGGAWDVDSCQLSEVQAAASRLNRLPLPENAPPSGLPDWLTTTRRFVEVGQGDIICHGLSYRADVGLVFR